MDRKFRTQERLSENNVSVEIIQQVMRQEVHAESSYNLPVPFTILYKATFLSQNQNRNVLKHK